MRGYGATYGTPVKRPLRLAIVDDYAVVVAGVASFLAEERIDVVETGASMPVITDVDVVRHLWPDCRARTWTSRTLSATATPRS